jgi:signal transduction histidine kinase
MFESESKIIEITVKADPDLPKIYVNYEEIKQAFLNIIKNAFESMPEGGKLLIESSQTYESPKMIEIIFTDQGVGIKKEAMDFLFSPFFTNKPRGNGLGLALCRRIIVERHHGTIHIESEEKKGTTVKVRLPITRLQEDTPGEAS